MSKRENHGKYKTGAYSAWIAMKSRCNRPTSANYPRYGGRGIKVCPDWDSFEAFYTAMGDKPSKMHTLDRIDVNGDYEPRNCRWISRDEQYDNRRNTAYVNFKNEKMTARQAYRLGSPMVCYRTFISRIRAGWKITPAMAIPPVPPWGLRCQPSEILATVRFSDG